MIARRVVVLGLGLTAAAAMGCAKSGEAPMKPAPDAIHVETVSAGKQPMPRTLPLTGTLVSSQAADVAANAAGQVVKTFVERGDYIKFGQPLAQLDMRTAKLSEAEARANLSNASAQQELAQSQCARYQQLFSRGAISRDEWDRISSQCKATSGSAEAARARADMAMKTLKDSIVRAPFAGLIAERYVSIGEYVQPSSKVVSLVELDPLRLQLTVSEADIGQVKQGLVVDFDVAAFPDEKFRGVVKFIGPAVRASSRDLVVEAEVKNADHRLRAGMFATAHLRLPDEPLAVVPKTALLVDGTTTRLFAVVGNRIEERVVELGPERGGMVSILDGLRPGDRVVAKPDDTVKDGTPVK